MDCHCLLLYYCLCTSRGIAQGHCERFVRQFLHACFWPSQGIVHLRGPTIQIVHLFQSIYCTISRHISSRTTIGCTFFSPHIAQFQGTCHHIHDRVRLFQSIYCTTSRHIVSRTTIGYTFFRPCFVQFTAYSITYHYRVHLFQPIYCAISGHISSRKLACLWQWCSLSFVIKYNMPNYLEVHRYFSRTDGRKTKVC